MLASQGTQYYSIFQVRLQKLEALQRLSAGLLRIIGEEVRRVGVVAFRKHGPIITRLGCG
jgi:hypothetical protein